MLYAIIKLLAAFVIFTLLLQTPVYFLLIAVVVGFYYITGFAIALVKSVISSILH